MRLSEIEAATIFMAELSEPVRIGVAAATLVKITDPHCAGALRDAAHKIARHADELERLFVEPSSGSLVGQCPPEDADEPASGHSPSGQRVSSDDETSARGAFSEHPHDT